MSTDRRMHRRHRLQRLVEKIAAHPIKLLKPSSWKRALRLCSYLDSADYSAADSWMQDGPFKTKTYLSYNDYLKHQKSKLETKDPGYLSEYDKRFHQALVKRLTELSAGITFTGRSALCLGARLGTEVRAFGDVGCFAIGIDLNPGPENRYVVYGDFHHLQFADGSVDFVYTNSFDHVFAAEQVSFEIARVLKPNGILLLELLRGKPGEETFGAYESFYWATVDDVLDLFARRGVALIDRHPIDQPWVGTLFVLRRQ